MSSKILYFSVTEPLIFTENKSYFSYLMVVFFNIILSLRNA